MARDIRAKAQIDLLVNGNDATQKLDNLRSRVTNLKKEITALSESGTPKDNARLTHLRKQFQELSRELRNCQSEVGLVNDVLRRLDSASPKELNKALRTLKSELNSIERGSQAWDVQVARIKLVEQEIDKVNDSLRTQESRFSRLNKWLNDSQTFLMGAIGAVTGLVMAGRKAVNEFAEMEQEMANVRKYTGMTAAEVNDLNEQFKKINTRSSRDELNRLAQEAGRLGKQSAEDVLGFVKAADKINVALDDLGEGATLTLSKLTGIFGDEKRLGTEKALLSVGSVINELSQNCSASAPYIAQFASRMGGVAAQTGMTVQQVMAFAAVLDTCNQGVEASSTALSQVITRLFQEPAKYAKVAGMDVKNFSDLLRKDTNAAVLEFLETLSKAGGMENLSPMFKDMGENGARAIAALSSLAEHISDVKQQQEVANEAFREASSIDAEFNVQNNTVMAGMEKAKNQVNELAISLGERLQPVMKYVYSSSSLFLRALNELVKFLMEYKTAIVAAAAGVAGYTAAVKLSVAASVLATGKTKLMTLAMQAFNAVTKANPIGLMVGALTALATAFGLAKLKSDEYSNAVKSAMKSAASFAEQAKEEQTQLKRLFGVLEGAKKGTKEYNDAKNSIISSYGVYLRGLINEQGEINNLALAYDRLSFAAQKAAQARGMNSARESLDTAFYQEVDSLTEKLRSSLIEMGMDEQKVTRLVTRVSQAVASGNKLTDRETSEILRYQYQHMGFTQSVKGVFSDDVLPSQIISKLMARQKDYTARSEKFQSMDQRVFQNVSTDELDKKIEDISNQLKESPRQSIEVEISVKDAESGRMLSESITENKSILPGKGKSSLSLMNAGKKASSLMDSTKSSPEKREALVVASIPMVGANSSMSGSLSRTEAESLLRELMYERSLRQSAPEADQKEQTVPEYKSEKLEEKERKKREAEERRELMKKKQEFRDGLAAIRAAMEAEDAKNTALYASGQKSYLEFLESKKSAELDYFDKAREYYEKHFSGIKDIYLEDDKDYQALLLKKEESEKKYDDKIAAYKTERLKREARIEEDKLKAEYDLKQSKTLDDELELQEKINKIKVDSLKKQQELYKSGSEKWEAIQLEIEQISFESKWQRENRLEKTLAEMKRMYAGVSASEQFKIELSVLQTLLDNEKIKIEDFEKWKRELRKKYAADLPGGNFEKSREELQMQRNEAKEKQKKQILDAVDSGVISKDEGDRRIRQLDVEELKVFVDAVKSCGSEWVEMLATVGDAYKDLWEAIGNDSDNVLSKIAAAAQSTFAVVGSGLQMAAEFAQANAQIEIKAIEKRYDREIELAQGNSYLVKKLEKDKEKATAEIKNKASKASFNMQVIQAIGQAITGALNAYTSTAAIPIIGPALAPAAAAVAAAAGAAQVVLLKKQQQAAEAQGYAEGGYTKPGTKYETAGVVHAGEWVASQELLKSPVAGPIIAALDAAQRAHSDIPAIRGIMDVVKSENVVTTLSKEDASRIVATGAATRTAAATEKSVVEFRQNSAPSMSVTAKDSQNSADIAELREVISKLNKRLEEPFYTINSVTGPHGMKSAEDEYNRLMNNLKRKSR